LVIVVVSSKFLQEADDHDRFEVHRDGDRREGTVAGVQGSRQAPSAFARNYATGQWIVREQNRLTAAIDRAAAMDAPGLKLAGH
jgi:hypothetical protein